MTPFVAPDSACGRLQPSAWSGLAASLVAVGVGLVLAGEGRTVGYAAFGPEDLKAWVGAICASIGMVAAALNGLAIVAHRWGRKPSKPRRPRKAADRAEPSPKPA